MSETSTVFAAFVDSYGTPIAWLAGTFVAVGVVYAILEMIQGIRKLYKKYQ